MKILLVIDQFDADNNGTTISAKRFACVLHNHGHQVRIITTGAESDEKYIVNEWRIPIFDGLIKSQGMRFAKPSKKKLKIAIEWADVVHFMMPFALSIIGVKMAEQLNVPHTAAFHVQPENITASIGLKNAKLINKLLYLSAKDIFYNHFTHIHCPSLFIANQLKKNDYTAHLHVISNGVESDFKYRKKEKTPEFRGKILIMMIGRLSAEKRQDVIIKAAKKSKYADKIQLIFAGQGPKRDELEKLGQQLKNPPIFRFFNKAELQDMLAITDLYIHAADIEIEAISCIEAFASGLVPIIANSSRSATPQFALDKRSLFVPGNTTDLAQTIDYWLDNPDERERMELKYSEFGQQFNIENSVYSIERMFKQAIEENIKNKNKRKDSFLKQSIQYLHDKL